MAGFRSVVAGLVSGEKPEHALLGERSRIEREAVVIFSSNRGLCGAFNTNLFRDGMAAIREAREAGRAVEIHTVGKKATSLLRFAGETVDHPGEMPDRPLFNDAVALAERFAARFTAPEGERVDRVTLIAARYESALRQPPARQVILPIAPEGDVSGAPAANSGATLFSPARNEIVERLIPLYLRSVVFQAMLEVACSEQVARRNAMKNATENARDMIKTLTRKLNKARQAAITRELAEIVGGASALR